MPLLINSYKCNICEDTVTSRNRHNYVTCSCGCTSVDGGLDYSLLHYLSKDSFENLCVYDNGKHELRRRTLEWGRNYTEEGIRLDKTEWIKICDMDDEHICNVLNLFWATLPKIYRETFEDEIIWREEQLMTKFSTKE